MSASVVMLFGRGPLHGCPGCELASPVPAGPPRPACLGQWDRVKPTAKREDDVQAELASAADLEEDTQRREEDGKDDLADIAVQRARISLVPRHLCCKWML